MIKYGHFGLQFLADSVPCFLGANDQSVMFEGVNGLAPLEMTLLNF